MKLKPHKETITARKERINLFIAEATALLRTKEQAKAGIICDQENSKKIVY